MIGKKTPRLIAATNVTPKYTYLILTQAYEPVAEICQSQDEHLLLTGLYATLYEVALLGISGGDCYTSSLVQVPTKCAEHVCKKFKIDQTSRKITNLESWLSTYDGHVVETHDIPTDVMPAIIIISEDNHVFISTDIIMRDNFYNCKFDTADDPMNPDSISWHIQKELTNGNQKLLTELKSVVQKRFKPGTTYKVDCYSFDLDCIDIECDTWVQLSTDELLDLLDMDEEVFESFYTLSL